VEGDLLGRVRAQVEHPPRGPSLEVHHVGHLVAQALAIGPLGERRLLAGAAHAPRDLPVVPLDLAHRGLQRSGARLGHAHAAIGADPVPDALAREVVGHTRVEMAAGALHAAIGRLGGRNPRA
jgi:hypothetical protein